MTPLSAPDETPGRLAPEKATCAAYRIPRERARLARGDLPPGRRAGRERKAREGSFPGGG